MLKNDKNETLEKEETLIQTATDEQEEKDITIINYQNLEKIKKVGRRVKKVSKKAKKSADKALDVTKENTAAMIKTFQNSSDETKRKPFSLSLAIFKGGYVYNPVLTQVLGVCPIVMLATTFSNSISLTVIVTIMLIACEAITSKCLKKVPRWVRVSMYTVISAAVVVPICNMLMNADQLSTAFSIYLPLVSVNGMLVIRCEKFACKTSVKNSIFDAIATGVGFGFVALIVGTVREIFVNGSIFGFTFANLQQLPSASMAFITLVLLGFFSALHKYSIMKYFPNETTDTFDLAQVFEKVSFSDSGMQTKKPTGVSRSIKKNPEVINTETEKQEVQV